jgi:hypothetical protein
LEALEMGGVVGWVIAIVMLALILVAATAPGDDGPLYPRRKVLRRHIYEKLLREEEREGVREQQSGLRRSRADDRPEPQAKWSNRR